MTRRSHPSTSARRKAANPGSAGRRRLLTGVGLLLCLCIAFFFIASRPLTISLRQEQVQQGLESAFPVRREVLVVAEVVLSRPQVTLTAGSDRVGFATDCVVRLLGKPQIQGRAYISGGLRFDPERGDLFLQDARVERLEIPGLPPTYEAAVTVAAREAAGEYLSKHPIYHVPEASVTLPLLGALRVRGMTVEDGVLKVTLKRGP